MHCRRSKKSFIERKSESFLAKFYFYCVTIHYYLPLLVVHADYLNSLVVCERADSWECIESEKAFHNAEEMLETGASGPVRQTASVRTSVQG